MPSLDIGIILAIVSILGTVVSIVIVFGVAVAFRSSIAKTAGEIQERVINALQSEITALGVKIEHLEKDNTRLTVILEIIQTALRKRGTFISIEGEIVSITDKDGSSQSTRVKP